MNLFATTPAGPQEAAPSEPLRFTYASGSRPLAGYTIKRGIGRGGFGEVYYAVSDGGKEVALKLVRRNLDIELRGVSQCLNLKHPNLLSLFDIKQDDQGDSWVIMEYVPGECLDDVIRRSPHGLPPEEVLRWMRGILAGVAYLHDHGIVHRDLKPGNVFSDEGVVKIGDYGLSKFISCSRRSGQTESVGTVHYMAPEIANGRYGKEIDLYAVGIIFYELLTGRVPFEGESVGEVLMKHLTAEPDLSALAEPYRTAVGRTLAKDPTQRVGSAQELAALLPGLGAESLGPVPPRVPVAAAIPPIPEEPIVLVEVQKEKPILQAIHNAVNDAERVFDEDEPILRAVRTNFRDLREWWRNNGWPKAVKILIVVGVGIGLIRMAPFWLPMAFFLAAIYAGYRVVRWMFVKPTTRTVSPAMARGRQPVAAQRVAAARMETPPGSNAATGKYRPFRKWRRGRWQELPPKTAHQQATELTGSLLLSTIVAAVVSFVMFVVRGAELVPELYAWMVISAVACTWGILALGKVWEGRSGDPMLRRFTLMVLGLGVGAIAFFAKTSLMVELPYSTKDLPTFYNTHSQTGMTGFYTPDHMQPSMLAFLAYFGFLFLIVRWWRQADPMRSSRLSIWSTVVTSLCAVAVNAVWPFPQPWGIMLAATVSICVQLASPWTTYNQRTLRTDY